MQNAKNNGVSKKEIAAIITHCAFYVGWPKAWAVFRLAKDVWDEKLNAKTEKEIYQNSIFFPIGNPNDAFKDYFVGQSYLAPICKEQGIFNVTFEAKCRNNWHIHKAKSGGGQILICVGGRGYYQEYGKKAIELKPGDCVNIPANVKHWHGAAKDSWFSHLAIEVKGTKTSNEWLEPVDDKQYNKFTKVWDKTFPKSEKVGHKKVQFVNRFGITLVADMYKPKNASGLLPAIAVCGPFGAVKEQASGLYAQTMA